MSPAIGNRLGPYELLEPIGAGGMGQVWKARDTRLDRIVAIKMAQARFSDRFEREARAVAALNHPNICQIYDVGPDYLVMEFVEGAPVAPVDSSRKLLDIAVQIADGLAAAHAAKIIHRDLKPDNILIARDGRVKILDFGLAKRADDLKHDDKTVVDVTEAGSTVGTVAYMSPEQARGQADLSAQSDQFSLGLVLYELSAGKKAFKRDSPAETMTAIIREDPEPLPETSPGPLRWIIERLLHKEAAERYDSTRDLYRELKQIRDRFSMAGTSGVSASLPASTAEIPHRSFSHGKSRVVIVATAAAIVATIATLLVGSAPGSSQQNFTPMEVSAQNPAIGVWSSDGKAFAYHAGPPGGRRVWLRYLNSPTATPITRGSDFWRVLGFSPDNKRVLVTGKNPRGDKPRQALFAVPVFGGDPEMIQPLDSEFENLSKDGKTLVTLRQENATLQVYTASPPGSELKRYSPAPFATDKFFNGPSIRFSPDGSFLVLTVDVTDGGRQVWKLPYPPGSGTPERILKNVPPYGGTPTLSFFPGGRIALITQQRGEGQRTHLWIAGIGSGKERQLTDGTATEVNPSVSPDGKEILFQQARADYSILSASLADATVERVISSELATGMPAWAGNQDKFVYESNRDGSPAIWMRAEGYDRPLVTVGAFPQGTTTSFLDPALSFNGDRVLYTRVARDGKIAPWISSVSGGPPIRLTNVENPEEFGGAWSPDGSQVVFVAIVKDQGSLMLVRTSGEAAPTLLRAKVGSLPVWSPDGKWIACVENTSDSGGWTLVSPDGKTVRTYGEPATYAVAFSADSKLLYGIRPEKGHQYLYSLDIATKAEKIIGDVGQEFAPQSYLNPGIRLSLSPDGKHILFPSFRPSASLWMLEGFQGPTWTERLRELMPW